MSIGGVILSIPRVQITGGSSHGLIIGAEPHIHFDVRTSARVRGERPVTARGAVRPTHMRARALQIFRPVPGLELVGVVKQARGGSAKERGAAT